MASGRTWHGRVAVEHLFERHGLDSRDHIIEALPRSDPGPEFQVNIARLAAATGRRPQCSLSDIVDPMVETAARICSAKPQEA